MLGAGEWWGLFSEKGTGIIKEAKVLLYSLVSPLCPKWGNLNSVLLLHVVGQHPCASPKGCFLRAPRALLLQSTGKAEGSGLDLSSRCVFLCPHRLARVLWGIRAALWKRRVAEPVSSVKIAAFCHRLTFTAQTKDGVWDEELKIPPDGWEDRDFTKKEESVYISLSGYYWPTSIKIG